MECGLFSVKNFKDVEVRGQDLIQLLFENMSGLYNYGRYLLLKYLVFLTEFIHSVFFLTTGPKSPPHNAI